MLCSKLFGFRRSIIFRSIYNWGNYDASAGQCRRMRDEEVAKCAVGKDSCSPKPMSAFEFPSFTRDKYPMHLQEIYERVDKPDHECYQKLVRHDKDMYKPSDKSRKFQRTWPECPLIWLRPRDTCCPDPERFPPVERRPRPPLQKALTNIEKHNFQMELFCKSFMLAKGCKQGRRPPDCHRIREVTDCIKTPAPMPSFSEVCRHLVPSYCPAECACLTLPTKCDGFAKYHRHKMAHKTCTKPLIAYKPRLQFPF
ncbi:uncharacterized protein LOC110177917 [Drosophila serrata]|uniref:uncharacterized protein LOC110177917 n=1 Tax=Drosophila serrata TaxID=7274 RepID=UPI000A1D322A|nr:uncharacterized protein LOC110177917 [Drosophila serrata]